MRITKCKLKNDQQVLGVLKKNTKGLTAYGVLRAVSYTHLRAHET